MSAGHDGPGEAELVRQATAGGAAFTALVHRYQKPLVNFAYRYLGQREEAEDVAQDALVRAYLSLAQLRQPEAFGSYLFRIALNLVRKRAARQGPLTAPLSEAAAVPDTDPLLADESARVAQAVAALPEDLRLPVSLHVQGGLAFAEIGDLLGISEGACRMRYHRARQLLRERLGVPTTPVEVS